MGGEEGIRLLEECAAVTREVGQTAALSACLRGLAVLVAPDDPDRADALLDQALGSALAAGEPWPMVYGWVERLAVRWQTRPREEALADSLRALDLIQALRELQGSETGRLGMGAVWSEAYYWLSGRLLGSQPSRREVEVAFDLAEQARSRSLLEDLAAPERTPEGAPDPAFQETVQQIVDLHRRLLDPATADGERRLLLERLDELEIREAALREGSRARAGVPEPVRLDGVQAALAPGEALLAFQLSPWQNPYGEFGGGSWLLVATRDRVRIHPVPDRSELQPMTDLLLGMVQRRDGSDAAAAAAFGARLLGAALAELPPDVHSLVIVPDGPLHQVPFAALRTAPGEPPLVERYRLSTVPSATLWAGWRRHPRPPDRRGALVFADPTPAGADPSRVRRPPADGAPILRNAALAVAWTPGPLPQARHEGRRVTALLGSGSRLLVGDGASEARAKGDVADVVAVHFAAHALVDGARPQRSAVLLAPGGGGEDGLLQAREIAALDLDDRLVVLSACRGASGTVLQGEGAMSLARAFFQAGARAVVAAPWPLRDDEARQLTEALYRRLARGEDLAGALAGAQREQARQGAPAAAWAGLQLHGDGAWAPFAPRPRPWRRWALLAAAAGAGLVLLLAYLAVRAVRTRRRRPA